MKVILVLFFSLGLLTYIINIFFSFRYLKSKRNSFNGFQVFMLYFLYLLFVTPIIHLIVIHNLNRK